MLTTTYATGSLVKVRGREWVVLPDSEPDFLRLRPLGGTDDEVAGIYLPVEKVEPAVFAWPDPARPGDHRSCRLLREAARLGFRATTGPFRSFASLAVEPRPYQLVPLLMALKLDPVRLLIADDVGIGKTVEALLVARELLERGDAQGLAVLCPPHLAEQWQEEMQAKFHLEAELVLPGTVGRLERQCAQNQPLFDRFPITVVSTDYIKSDRRREDFLRECPDLVIVDEAHTCASAGQAGGRSRHQRHLLLRGLAAKPERHMLLVTATPHSGNEDAFRSLLSLLHEDFATLPEDLTGNETLRRQVAAHLVQRRRGDLASYLDSVTPFPEREEKDETYKLGTEGRKLLDDVLAYAREIVRDQTGGAPHQRVRWWSALALLRTLASSPAAAAATLKTRAATLQETSEETDELGQRSVLDQTEDEPTDGLDANPGADISELSAEDRKHYDHLQELAGRAEGLKGKADAKLEKMVKLVQQMLADGSRPILFCRFIATAEYVAEELRSRLKGAEVQAVTGLLPPAEREARVEALAAHAKPVLVCTDCLSEGINLQHWFDAVIHYDLSWNPTRHEQREGRVDRYGQGKPRVRVLTYFGSDNPVDGIVLEVLLKKHKAIRSSLGISVPVPTDTSRVVEALMEGLLLRGQATAGEQLTFDFVAEEKSLLHNEWDTVTQRERRSRSLFAQASIKVEEVVRELEEVRAAQGTAPDVSRFVREAVELSQGAVKPLSDGSFMLDLLDAPTAVRDAMGAEESQLEVRFEPPPGEAALLTRTHPLVEGLASYLLDSSLDPLGEGRARRTGVVRTRAVSTRTTLLLVRLRFDVVTRRRHETEPHRLLAEELALLAFEGAPSRAQWLAEERAEALLAAGPDANVDPGEAVELLRRQLESLDAVQPHLEELSRTRSRALLEAHRRVRDAAGRKGVQYDVEPRLPLDILGLYLYLPA